MAALFKKAFARVLIVFIVLPLEVAVIFGLVMLAETISRWLYTILLGLMLVIYIGCFFRLALRDEPQECKTPWWVCLILVPIFGPIIYLTFSTKPIRKKEQQILKRAEEKALPYLPYEEQQIYIDTFMYARYFNYLRKLTYLTATKGNRIKYYKTGESWFPDLFEALESAKEFIFFEFFIIDQGEIWERVHEILKRKASEGVEVRLLMDDVGCAGLFKENYYKELQKEGIKADKFNKFSPILSGIYNNRDHRKIVVVDHKYAFTGGANVADEYANLISRFGYWKDTMVRVEGPGINNFIALFLSTYDLATKTSSDYKTYMDYQYETYDEEGYAFMFGDNGGPYDYEAVGERNYLNMINGAKKEIFISTPYLVPTRKIMDALIEASDRGVNVTIIFPSIPDKAIVFNVGHLNIEKLLKAGVHVYSYTPGFNHMKTVLVDDEVAFVGSINFDYRSLIHHFECGVLLYKTPCLSDIREDFMEMISVSKEIPVDFKLKGAKRFSAKIASIFSQML
ncbi:MAG: cardiolipin synthase [Bacilli bacterium]|nr:cardiolipin synthase [Bacilli bacterium]